MRNSAEQEAKLLLAGAWLSFSSLQAFLRVLSFCFSLSLVDTADEQIRGEKRRDKGASEDFRDFLLLNRCKSRRKMNFSFPSSRQ
jgi:hypothetical protein